MLNSFEHVYESGTLVMESGQLALQANGSILVKQGDCALLVYRNDVQTSLWHRFLPTNH